MSYIQPTFLKILISSVTVTNKSQQKINKGKAIDKVSNINSINSDQQTQVLKPMVHTLSFENHSWRDTWVA